MANRKSLTTSFVGAVNIGTSIETDVNGIYNGVKEALKSKIAAKHGPAKPGEQKRSCLNNKKAKQALGWKPMVLLNKGLKITTEYFKAK